MDIKRIIREEINDFGWIDESPIEVGKCVTLKSNNHGDILVKISEIQTPKDTDKLNDLAILNRTRVYFDMFHTGYPAMSLKYSEVENYINSDVIIPLMITAQIFFNLSPISLAMTLFVLEKHTKIAMQTLECLLFGPWEKL